MDVLGALGQWGSGFQETSSRCQLHRRLRWLWKHETAGLMSLGLPSTGNDGTIYVAAHRELHAVNPDG